jgi:hypothetical protein
VLFRGRPGRAGEGGLHRGQHARGEGIQRCPQGGAGAGRGGDGDEQDERGTRLSSEVGSYTSTNKKGDK